MPKGRIAVHASVSRKTSVNEGGSLGLSISGSEEKDRHPLVGVHQQQPLNGEGRHSETPQVND